MSPAIKSVQRVFVRPIRGGELVVGQVALAEVHGRFWLHFAAERDAEVHIQLDNGMVNGWTPRASVFGVLN